MNQLRNLTAFRMEHEQELNGIHSKGMILTHIKTGARVCLVSNEDENKVFQIGFRTPPEDNTGVPHIIEHTVLCGSEKYPLKDPFVELMKGSLNTFINAITYPDKTIYPVASCNDADFHNLCDVYLDAVFHPNIYLKEEIFQQEGWHYEMESPDGELTLNGVVYNEMKGAYSSPEEILGMKILQALYPETCYSKDSGGNPKDIPSLTREAYLDFHRRYYHPSNSFIYLYGNMDMAKTLDWIDKEYLSQYDFLAIDSEITQQKPFKEVVKCHDFYHIASTDTTEDRTYLSYNVVVGNALDPKLYIAFDVLQYALFTSPGAPVKQALLDAGVGKDVTGSYNTSMMQPYFSITAQNANPGDQDRFLKIIKESLENLVEHKISRTALEAGINSSEFRYREADFGNFPKGLLYGIQILDSWLYDESKPFIHLEALETYAYLREQINTGYFEQLIKEYLLDNTHGALVCLEPKKGINDMDEEALKEKLEKIRLRLTDKERAEIVEQTAHLKQYQEEPTPTEDLLKIPLLSRSDLETKPQVFINQEVETENTKIIFHEIPTNGITYLTLCFRMEELSEDLIPYASLLKTAIGYVSTSHYSYAELSSEIDRKTGGISSGISLYPNVEQDNIFTTMMEIRCKTFTGKLPDAIGLICEMIKCSNYQDEKRLYEIVAELKAKLQVGISASGHSAAILRANSYFFETSRYRELLNGIEFYHFIERLEQNFDQEKEILQKRLMELEKIIFRPENLLISITCEKDGLAEVKESVSALRQALFTDKISVEKDKLKVEKKNEGFMDASQVQYVARSGNFKEAGYEYTGSMSVVKNIMNCEYLWLNIRVKGGAYGCMSGFARNGSMYFASYRDPNLKKTNEIFEKAADYLADFSADEREMTKYIIGTISAMDTPMTPSTKGERSLGAYLTGLTYQQLEKERRQVLETQPEDIREIAKPVRAAMAQNYICVIGNEGKIRQDADLFQEICSLN